MNPFGNPLLVAMVSAELALLVVFLAVPPVSDLLGGSWPHATGWLFAAAAALAVPVADGLWKALGTKVPRNVGPPAGVPRSTGRHDEVDQQARAGRVNVRRGPDPRSS